MDNFLGEAIVLEAMLGSVLLALWMTWFLMRGLFKLMPATSGSTANRPVTSVPSARDLRRGREDTQRRAA
jgi:hypothetical protein